MVDFAWVAWKQEPIELVASPPTHKECRRRLWLGNGFTAVFIAPSGRLLKRFY